MLEDSLWKNLTLGAPDVAHDSPEAELIWKITEALGLSQELQRQPNTWVIAGGLNLRASDRAIVCLTRAFVSGAHVLLLAKPTSTFQEVTRQRFYALMADWVYRRGIFQGDSSVDQVSVKFINRSIDLASRSIILTTVEKSLPTQLTHIATISTNNTRGSVTQEMVKKEDPSGVANQTVCDLVPMHPDGSAHPVGHQDQDHAVLWKLTA